MFTATDHGTAPELPAVATVEAMAPLTVIARRVAWLLVLILAGGALFAWIRGRSTPQLGAPPEWPPLEPPAPVAAPDTADGSSYEAWVEPPADGSIPESHPIKVNLKSGVFHVPGGRFYDRTNGQRYYATAEAAVADGYRQSKS